MASLTSETTFGGARFRLGSRSQWREERQFGILATPTVGLQERVVCRSSSGENQAQPHGTPDSRI